MNTLEKIQGVLALRDRFAADIPHSDQVRRLAESIFDQLKQLPLCDGEDPVYLIAGALLHDIGQWIDLQQHEKHSQALILKHGLPGFNDLELRVIACIARYHRRTNPEVRHPEFVDLPVEWQNTVRIAASILRIADGLDEQHQNTVQNIEIQIKGQTANFYLTGTNLGNEIKAAILKRELLEETLQLQCKFIALNSAESKNIRS